MRTLNYIAPLALALALTACGEATESESGASSTDAVEAGEAAVRIAPEPNIAAGVLADDVEPGDHLFVFR